MGIVLKNILAVLPEGEKDVVKETDIYIEGSRIAAIGQKPEGFIEEKVIDGKDRLAIPGLINCHTHSYMSFMRNVADDLSFMDWLFGSIDPIEQKMTDEDTYWGACLAIIEMMKSGTTCFNDMQMNIHQTTRAVKESGMRAVISRGLVGEGDNEAGQMRLSQAYEERDAAKDCDRLTFMLGPHAPYTCDDAYMRIISEEAKKNHMGIHVHLSESESEIQQIKEKYGCSPIEMADKNGLFDVPAIAAHCVQITESDMDILKEKNVSVVTNPASNMKLGNGFAPVPRMMEKGINVCLGTDGAASNNSLNLFHELSLLTLIHKGVNRTPQCVSAREGLRIATINGAKALGLEKETGSLEVGKKADIAILDLNTPSLTPRNNLIAGLSYSANGSEVETVIIDGKVTMENRKVLTLDEELVYQKINEIIVRMELDKKEY
ncbi:5-methylthioadenosine/S-adenosylhomocysteine deaminase [Lachnospiraceae bacterium]|jgi:5-methylthioadenosine/S-adenosylhomocysteine deaminase|nr:amidohydrolase [Lachnospiraceae bacterium]GFI69042.1 5-methylthioadenosine/S-adenosylhomocysteine deaminase [Lachnospiraceae bacterium]